MDYSNFSGAVSSERFSRYLSACEGNRAKAIMLYRLNQRRPCYRFCLFHFRVQERYESHQVIDLHGIFRVAYICCLDVCGDKNGRDDRYRSDYVLHPISGGQSNDSVPLGILMNCIGMPLGGAITSGNLSTLQPGESAVPAMNSIYGVTMLIAFFVNHYTFT